MYTPILGVLGYVLHPDGERVLLVHRSRDGDQHQGKYNGLGGKVENDEDVVSALCRELREEAGIEVVDWRLRGTISWPGFGAGGEDWVGFEGGVALLSDAQFFGQHRLRQAPFLAEGLEDQGQLAQCLDRVNHRASAIHAANRLHINDCILI